jgi:hypothetical protein
MKFANKQTGEISEVDAFELRLSRLKNKLKFFSSWKDELEEFSEIENIMVTLTYRNVADWKAKHVTEFIRKVKRYLGTALFGYFWVAEMQSRGAVHYHLIFVVSKGIRLPMPDKEGLWIHGMTRIEQVKHIYSYLSKYLQKDEQKAKYPKGIRIFGCSIYVLQEHVRLLKLPLWLQKSISDRLCKVQDHTERMKLTHLQKFKKVKGGYQADDFFFPSPYAYFGFR